MRPKFNHGCDNCTFLGRILGGDAYYCAKPLSTSYLIRFSSDGPDYVSARDMGNSLYHNLSASYSTYPAHLHSNHNHHIRRLVLFRLLAPELAHRMEKLNGN
jgi:hypothetical protein